MKFRDFVESVNQLLKKHPEAANMEVVTSSDEEGNSYNKVIYAPSIGYYQDDEFTNNNSGINNAVCIN